MNGPLDGVGQVYLQNNKGDMFVGDTRGKSVSNIRLVPEEDSSLDVLLDPGLVDTDTGRYTLNMRLMADIFFYDMLAWLVFAFVGFIVFAVYSPLMSLLPPVFFPVAIGLSLVAIIGSCVAASLSSSSPSQWKPGPLLAAQLVSVYLFFVHVAVYARIVSPLQFFVIQWAMSLGTLLYVIRARSSINLVYLQRVIIGCAGVSALIGIVSYNTQNKTEMGMAFAVILLSIVSGLHRYNWIVFYMASTPRFTSDESIDAWASMYSDPPKALLGLLLHKSPPPPPIQ